MKKGKINKNKGFTIFELLVVIFIVGIVSSILVVNWQKNERQYRLQRSAHEIAQNIRKVQGMALNGFKYDPALVPPPYYGVYFSDTIPNSYIMFADTGLDGTGGQTNKCCSGDVILEQPGMETGVEIESFFKKKTNEIEAYEEDVHLTFSLPDGFATVDPVRADTIGIIIRIKKTNGICPQDCRTIVVEKTGKVSVEDGEVIAGEF